MAEWLTPITDRTEADTVEAFNNQMIEAHLKGALNYSDLNRIENNYKYLIENLQKNGYYVNHKYRNYTETEPVVTKIEVPGTGGTTGGIVEPYLQSSGTQYIKTGFVPNQNTKITMEAELLTRNGSAAFYGSRTASGSQDYSLWAYGSVETLQIGYGTKATVEASITGYKRMYEQDKNKLYVDNQLIYTMPVATFVPNYEMLLFTCNNNGTSYSNCITAKVYSCQIYDNGTLVRDFIPKLDDNGVACLYDKVEGKYYYNAGTGSFTYGENVYTPVQYIESSGTQRIDTGYKFTSDNVKINMKFSYVSVASGQSITGMQGASSLLVAHTTTSGNLDFYVGSSGQMTGVAVVANTSYELEMIANNGTFTRTLNGNTASHSYSGSMVTGYSPYIFANNVSGVTKEYSQIKLMSYKMYDNDTLVRDFIPVIDASGVALLYDQLNGVPYFNAGTGSFVAGTVIPPTPPSDPTIEYIVEYVQNTYTEWFEQNLPWKSEIDRIRRNFNNLLKEYLYGKRISQVPYTQYFKFTEANKLEDISASTKQLLENMIAEYRYCGTVNSGGDRLL